MDGKKKSAPQRTCLGCRAVKSQSDLLRLALIDNAGNLQVVWDAEKKIGGRGAWLCRDKGHCLASALKKRAFKRAFKVQDDICLSSLEAPPPKAAG